MSTPTTNMAMGKAADGDNAKTYLETTLASALDKIDAHDHSGTTHGLNNFTGGLQISAGNVGIGVAQATSALLALQGALSTAGQYGILVTPTFAPSGATSMYGVNINASSVAQAASAKYGLYVDNQTGANGANYGIYVVGASGATISFGAFINSGLVVGTGGNAAASGGAGYLSIGNGSTNGATAGGNSLPANPTGFLSWNLNGSIIKVPYYNN